MVWFVNKLMNSGFHSIESTIFQATNLLFNIHRTDYDNYDLFRLWRAGANMVNVDRTIHDKAFLDEVKKNILYTQEYKLGDNDFYKPMGLSVTMSVKDTIDVDVQVDVIILKDVFNTEDMFGFRKKNNLSTDIPILFLVSVDNLQNLSLVIKLSDGIVLDLFEEDKIVEEHCSCIKNLCRETCKPIICMRKKMPLDLNILPMALRIANSQVDGIMIEDDIDSKLERISIYNLVCSLRFAEKEMIFVKYTIFDFTDLIKTPANTQLSVAISASLVALNSNAKLIIVLTNTGRSARWLSCAKPHCHILAVTTRKATARRLHLYRKVIPLLYDQESDVNWRKEWQNRVHFATDFALRVGLIKSLIKLVLLLPSKQDLGYCDTVQLISTPIRKYLCED